LTRHEMCTHGRKDEDKNVEKVAEVEKEIKTHVQ
jgi:hypothetical protein